MFADIMKYKELLYFLVHKEVRIRYRNSIFGFLWTLLEPLGLMAIYALVFGEILNKNLVKAYPLFILMGLIPWTFFNNTLRRGTKALSGNVSLIKKVYFPREIFPITILLANLVNFVPAFILVFVIAMFTPGLHLQWYQLIYLPGALLLQCLFTLACTFLVSVLNVYYRDVEFIVNLMLRAWMYLCPIIYPVSLLGASKSDLVREFAWLYFLNPMAVIISMYHGIFYPKEAVTKIPPSMIIFVIILSLLLLVFSWWIFKRLNRRVGEVI
ncbi:ABC-2 type transport system permease protein/lipopolysaccharide transport system permease protein [Marininema mesophilum]|uniref:Transport permease protein n=1 Tax=Marininema mesophilum TaxID=1048340 RepID=A0A1H2YXD8_9BACL|nr:ABC transporter permease [Marininema mesophilum]SDX09737.1 ABC-2 type transport system permease protein/lipopolysaccharide transport system permease protein [Marininema mesophilum]